jgi:hypothetical protein
MMLTVDSCCRLLRFEFFDGGIEIGRPVVRTAHSFDMSTIAKAATIVETSLPDQVANMVHVGGRFIPTGLIIASGADVMVGAGDVTPRE